jgi:hypothetical protein
MTSDSFKKAPALLEAFAPSADHQLRAIFESLVLATMTAPTKSPVSASFDGDRPHCAWPIHLVVFQCYWSILDCCALLDPPGTDAGGVWSNLVLTVVGAPRPTVDTVSVDRLKAFPGARTLASSGQLSPDVESDFWTRTC